MVACKLCILQISQLNEFNCHSLITEKELMLASSFDELAAAGALANCLLKSERKATRFEAN